MKFQVLSDEQLTKPIVITGRYRFRVSEALETKSKAQNVMIKVGLVDSKTNKFLLYDYLLCDDKNIWKISQFCKSIGKEDLYKSGNINEVDLLNCEGECDIVNEFNKEKERYYAKVNKYIKKDSIEESISDDIPF